MKSKQYEDFAINLGSLIIGLLCGIFIGLGVGKREGKAETKVIADKVFQSIEERHPEVWKDIQFGRAYVEYDFKTNNLKQNNE